MKYLLPILLCSCATVTRHVVHDSSVHLQRACTLPLVVAVDESDTPPEMVEALDEAIADWNGKVGMILFVRAVWGSDNANAFVLAEDALDDPDVLARTTQHSRRACSFGSEIQIVVRAVHMRTYEYAIKHELGHALGLPHQIWGVMNPVQPDWLPDYYLTGGVIDLDDISTLQEMYR